MSLPNWSRAWGEPPVIATLRSSPEDFAVEELLGFEPDGTGEHAWLWIEKRNLNTVDAARRIARFAGVREGDVSYAGLKDRQAVTRQWLSIHLPGRGVDWSAWEDADLQLLRCERHSRKLRRGTHRGNRFRLVLRDVVGHSDALRERAALIASEGVPNYYGPQRFGRQGANIEAARQWLAEGRPRRARHLQSLWLSSLRSLVFNDVLDQRVRDGSWREALPGELYILAGSNSVFLDDGDAALSTRLATGDIHASGPLVGRPGKLQPANAAAALEAEALQPHAELIDALATAGLSAERRALRLMSADLAVMEREAGVWQLDFSLPRGCFATSLVRELAALSGDG